MIDSSVIIDLFHKEYGLVHHQIEAYNKFVEEDIDYIIKRNRLLEIEHKNQYYRIEFEGVEKNRPKYEEIDGTINYQLFPKECIDRDISYVSELYVNVKITRRTFKNDVYKICHRIFLGTIPVMVKSKLCNLHAIKDDIDKLRDIGEDLFDIGGYFIIKGQLKIITCQQKNAFNKILVFARKKISAKFMWYAEVRSYTCKGTYSKKTQVGIDKDNIISVIIPYIDGASIPLGIIFKALGVISEEEMTQLIFPLKDIEAIRILTITWEASFSIKTEEDALFYIGSKGKKFSNERKPSTEEPKKETIKNAISYAKHLISTEFLLHLNLSDDDLNLDDKHKKISMERKILFLSCMVRRLINVYLGRDEVSDRDHYKNKRVSTVRTLFRELFFSTIKKLNRLIINSVKHCATRGNVSDIQSVIKSNTISNSMKNALTNNNWMTGSVVKKGISQRYDTPNVIARISNARRLITPISVEGGKIEQPRRVHNSHDGIVCIFETPEGPKCGLVTTLALMGLITMGSNPEQLIELLSSEIIPIGTKMRMQYKDMIVVFVNGIPIGLSKDHLISHTFRELRRNGGLNPELSISYNSKDNEIHFNTDEGRLYRPLLIVKDGELVLKQKDIEEIKQGLWDDESGNPWNKLLCGGYIEFVDKMEEEELLVAYFPEELEKMDIIERKKYTHCEIDPCAMMGVSANLIPFSDRNQAPRNSYHASMLKQAIGIPFTNYNNVTKGKFFVLDYPQKPIIRTKVSKIIGYDRFPCGQNAMVAICPFYGFGQEDSIIMNKSSIDRGFMSITAYNSFEGKVKSKNELIEFPLDHECMNKSGNFDKLNKKTGIINEFSKDDRGNKYRTKVTRGDILIGMTKEVDDFKKKKSISIMYDQTIDGQVHSIHDTTDEDGYRMVRVIITQSIPPEYGDKFAAIPAQKSTVGMIYNSEDLPFTREGITPDIILNPAAFPSRMTIGLLIEILMSRRVCSGSFLNSLSVKHAFSMDTKNQKDKIDDFKDIKYSKNKGDCDASAFRRDFSIKDIVDELTKLGYNGFCEEIMTNGQTGREMESLIFMGICSFHRLKLLVSLKLHCRSTGVLSYMTRQPTEGRKGGGGLRIGTMERDEITGQGAPNVIIDRLMEQSDEYSLWVCRMCGLIGTVLEANDGEILKRECRICQMDKLVKIKIPYATKLLLQEFYGMNIIVRVLVDEFIEKGDEVAIIHPHTGEEHIIGEVVA